MGGSDEPENLVLLSPREHFVAHLILVKITEGTDKMRMAYAFFRMKANHPNSKVFSFFREHIAKLTSGAGNPFYGRKHTERSLVKMRGENHPMFGKRHSLESRQKMSLSKRGRFKGHLNPMFGTKHSPEWRENHSRKISGPNHPFWGTSGPAKGRVWMNLNGSSKMVPPAEVESRLKDGWSLGRP